MTTAARSSGFTADDLLHVRDAFGTAHIEIDPWGNLIVSPATLQHERAIVRLAELFGDALRPRLGVFTNAAFAVPGSTGHLFVPDLVVMPHDVEQDEANHLSVVPSLILEVASPSSRHADRGRKADEYALLATTYLLVDLPGLAPVTAPTVEVRLVGSPAVRHVSPFELHVDGVPVRIDPSALPRR